MFSLFSVVECVFMPARWRCVVVPLLLLWSLPFPVIERLVAEGSERSVLLELA